jgi:sugar phosphate isomerase/epimerase
MKLGYCLWGMPKVEITESIPRLAAIGYQGVELTVVPGWSTALETLTPERRKLIRSLLNDHGVALTAVAGHSDIVRGEPEAIARSMQRLKDSIDLAAELATPKEPGIMVSLVGGRPEDWEAQKNVLVERVRELALYAGERGVIYATELHTGTLMDVPDKLIWVLDQITDAPYLSCNYDVSHTETMGIPLEVAVPVMGSRCVHTHVKDQRGLWPNHEFLTPGEGPCDYVKYMRLMDQAGYKGFIMVEVSVMRQRKPDYEPFVHAAFAFRVLDYAFQAAGVVREK